MSNIIADLGAMEASAGHVDNVNTQLQSEIKRIGDHVLESAGSWKGSARDAFVAIMADFNDASTRLNNVLGEIAQSIRDNGKGFDQAEQQNQANIHKAGQSGNLGAAGISSLNIQS